MPAMPAYFFWYFSLSAAAIAAKMGIIRSLCSEAIHPGNTGGARPRAWLSRRPAILPPAQTTLPLRS